MNWKGTRAAMRLRLMLVTAAWLLVLGPFPAFADQISLGGDGIVNFASSGGIGSPITMTSLISSLSTGSFESPTGTLNIAGQPWSLTFPSTFSIGGLVAGQFTSITNGSGTLFSWGGNGGGTITGTANWTLVSDNTPIPRFIGQLIVTGDTITASQYGGIGAKVLADFPVGLAADLDFLINLGSNASLDAVFNHTGGVTTTGGSFSSGEVAPVPEPTTLLLVGLGMIGLGAAARRRLGLMK